MKDFVYLNCLQVIKRTIFNIPVIQFHGLSAQFQVWLTILGLKALPLEEIELHLKQGQPVGKQQNLE